MKASPYNEPLKKIKKIQRSLFISGALRYTFNEAVNSILSGPGLAELDQAKVAARDTHQWSTLNTEHLTPN